MIIDKYLTNITTQPRWSSAMFHRRFKSLPRKRCWANPTRKSALIVQDRADFLFVLDENPVTSRRPSPPGCGLTHTVTHMRKGVETAGCGRKAPGGKLGGDFWADFAGEWAESVLGGYGRARSEPSVATEWLTPWKVPALAGGGSLPSPSLAFLCLSGEILAQIVRSPFSSERLLFTVWIAVYLRRIV